MLLQVKQDKTNRITLFTKFNYAFRNVYYDDFYKVPEENENARNSCIYFISSYRGEATVDWGDGITEVYQFVQTSSSFVLAFRTLDTEYMRKNNLDWGLGTHVATGEYVIPYPNHHYEDDDKNELRTVTITFSNEIRGFNSRLNILDEFPILETPALTSLDIRNSSNIKEIPLNRITKLKELRTLGLYSLGNTLEYIPDSIFELTKLTSLAWAAGLNLSDVESSNIRRIKNLTNLTSLDLNSCRLKYYLKEFNDLPKLQTLRIGNGNTVSNSPDCSEVNQINQNLKIFSWLVTTSGSLGARKDWGEGVTGKGLENITHLTATNGTSIPLTLPLYIREMRSMSTFSVASSLNTHLRTDTFINNLYEYITEWEYISMSTWARDGKMNQFYGLSVVIYNPFSTTPAFMPSGILQAPEGFEEGVSDGNPTTPMEKIFVLTQNYNQEWTLKPADTKMLSDSIFPELEYNQIIDNRMIVSKKGVIYKNEVITLSEEEFQERENITQLH